MLKDFVETAANAAEVTGVLVIIGGMLFAGSRYAFVRAGDVLGRYNAAVTISGRARRPLALAARAGAGAS